MIEIILFVCVGLVPAIVLHEFAHGWVANQLGDSTARLAGRLTLNPFKHVDPVGSILIPGILLLTKSPFLFGWAKPVPVNFSRLNNPKRDMMFVALAGPAINIALAFVLAQMMRWGVLGEFNGILRMAFEMNLILAVFNMIPVPPLDGSRVVTSFLPNRLAYEYSRLEPFGIFIVLILVNFGFLKFVYPIVDLIARLMGVVL